MTRLQQRPVHSHGPAATHTARDQHTRVTTDEEAASAATGESQDELSDWAYVSYVKVLPGRTEAVPASRAFVHQVFGAHPHLHDAKLIISELVTNATRHTKSQRPGGQVVVEIAYDGCTSRLAVIDDGGPITPNFNPPPPDELRVGSRGLVLVAAYAQRSGWHYGIDGRRVVWAQLGPHPAGSPT